MQCTCGGETQVQETRTMKDVPIRKRKCKDCKNVFITQEVFMYSITEKRKAREEKLKDKLYTKPEAAEINRKRVAVRRKAEDIKQAKTMRVPDYFIEDEEDW